MSEDKDWIKEYPAPKKDMIFVETWNEFIEDVASRDNFRRGHLKQLRILCDLYQDMEVLAGLIRTEGYTFVSEGRNGVQEKLRPEVQQLNKTRTDIAVYSKMLGLVLVKGPQKIDNEPEVDEWE